jgi:hypothetical protein
MKEHCVDYSAGKGFRVRIRDAEFDGEWMQTSNHVYWFFKMYSSCVGPHAPPQLAPPAPTPVLPRFELYRLKPLPMPMGIDDVLLITLLRLTCEWFLAGSRVFVDSLCP